MKIQSGHYALVTGAAGGIGFAICELLAQKEVNLYLVDFQKVKLDNIANDLADQFPAITIKKFCLDLTDYTAVQEMTKQLSKLDILINNAGVAFGGSFEKMDFENIERTLSINLLSTIHLTHSLIPLLKSNASGQIVNIASGAGLVGPGGMVAYGASKFGLVGFSEALRVELKTDNIGVSVVCPGFVKTDLITNSSKTENAYHLKPLNTMVQKQGDTPLKVAKAVLRAIERNKSLITVGTLTKGGYFVKRFFPSLANHLNGKNYQKLIKEGTIK